MSCLSSQVLCAVSLVMFSCHVARGQLFGEDDLQPPSSGHFLSSSDGSALPDSRGDGEDLTVQETRHQNKKQSYNRRSKPVRHQYSTQSQHSDQKGSKGGKGNGGYEKSGSWKGKKGYSTFDTFDRASRDKYADSDHKKYGNQDGNKYGHGKQGGDGRHHSSYTQDVEDFY